MSANDEEKSSLEPPSYLMEEVPLPDDEWMPADSGPRDDAPPPDDDWMPSETGPRNDAPPPEELWASSSRPSAGGSTAPAVSDGEFGRGVEVKIVSGNEGVGVVGEIFWWGESKYGEGMRAGVKGPGDTTYWVDEEHLGWPGDDVPEEVLEAAAAAPNMKKGDRVRVKGGRDAGKEGVIFWWGESKYGEGMRAGLKTDDDQTIWSDAGDLEVVE